MHILGVVPIFMSAGAAVLPTVVAAVTSVVAILFKPRELLRLCRRRPLAMGSSVIGLALAISTLVWWMERPAQAMPVTHGPQPTDWSGVARLIQQRMDATPGKLAPRWQYQLPGTMFLSTPAVYGDHVFVAGCASDVGGYTGTLACLDVNTGKKIWEVLALNDDVLKPFFSSPAVTADGKYMLIGQGLHEDRDCNLYCFEAATGKLHWAVKSPLHIESSPAIFGDLAVVGAGAIEGPDGRAIGDPGYVFAVRISDGKEMWRQAVNDPESEPVIDEAGIVYIGSGFNGSAVVALRSESDEALKAKGLARVVWKTSVDYPATGRVTLAGDAVVIGGGNSDMVNSNANPRGQVVALDRKTGKILWKTPVADSVLGAVGYRDGVLMAPSRTGEVLALQASDGKVLWRAAVHGHSPVVAGCLFTESRVYTQSNDAFLVALDPKTGKVQDSLALNDPAKPGSGLTMSTPVLAGGLLFVGTETGGMKCLEQVKDPAKAGGI